MPELKTTSLHRPATWLPSFDLHEEDGELVLHADLGSFNNEDVEISLDGGDLIVQAEGEARQDAPVWYYSRLPLPFAPQTLRVVSRPGHEDLEIRINMEAPMNWEEARNRELVHWAAVRDAIGTAAPLELLTEINAADAFCEKAREETDGAIDYCARCLFYQQFGGCRETSAQMSEHAAAGDWDGLRARVEELIDHLRAFDAG